MRHVRIKGLAAAAGNLEWENFLRNFFRSEMFYQSEASVKSKKLTTSLRFGLNRDAAVADTRFA